MSADFTPSFGVYKETGGFKFWCQKVLPLVYDDSLSYYETLCKVVKYLNDVIANVDVLHDDVDALRTAYTQLQSYVNSYFDNLDVQNEINQKLDDMADDGSLSALLSPIVATQIGGVVGEQIDAVVGSQIDASVGRQIDESVASQIGTPTATATTAWLNEHVNPVGSAVVVDDTLTISGAAADAKVCGDELSRLNNALSDSTGYENVAIEFAGIGYIDEHLNVYATTSSWRYSTPIAVEKYKTYSFICSENSNVSAITRAESDGTLISVVKMASASCITWISDFDGYVVLCFNLNNPYSFVGYYLTSDYKELPTDVTTLEAIVTNGTLTINIADLTFESYGFISASGDYVSTSSTTHKIMKMDASHLRYLKYQTAQTIYAAFGVLKDANGNKLQTFPINNTTDPQEYEIEPVDGNVLYISWLTCSTVPNPYYSSFDAKSYETIDEAYGKGNNIKYHHCVKKPFDFSGKTAYFFGDSITYGYIAQSGSTPAHQATNNYPVVFSTSVGATGTNYGESGTTLSVVTGHSSIYTKIQNTSLTGADYVFVSGGINDWQSGVDETTLEGAVKDICDYLTANFTGEVIFVTPINEAGRVPNVTPQQTLQNVRNVITRIALKYGYSVVQGWEFPFPLAQDDSDYISLMFQDKLHPTELGYAMYAQALRSALC